MLGRDLWGIAAAGFRDAAESGAGIFCARHLDQRDVAEPSDESGIHLCHGAINPSRLVATWRSGLPYLRCDIVKCTQITP